MAAYLNLETHKVAHVSEGSWQHDFMEDRADLWRPATDEEVAAAANIYNAYYAPLDASEKVVAVVEVVQPTDELTKDELAAEAETLGIAVKSSSTKAELAAAVDEARLTQGTVGDG